MLLREVLVEDDCRELVDCLVVVAVVVVVVLVGGTEGIVVVVVVVTSVVVAVGLDIGYTVAAVDDSAAAAADSSEPTIGLVDPAPDSIADLDVDTIVVPIDFVVVVAEHLRLYHLHHPMPYLSFH